jgi:hypothetical protein
MKFLNFKTDKKPNKYDVLKLVDKVVNLTALFVTDKLRKDQYDRELLIVTNNFIKEFGE